MSVVALHIVLVPLIGWGFFPAFVSKVGGKLVHYILGASVGA
ncbi:GRP family sugar transporter, partial [Staphylococcus aureus]